MEHAQKWHITHRVALRQHTMEMVRADVDALRIELLGFGERGKYSAAHRLRRMGFAGKQRRTVFASALAWLTENS